MDYAEGQAPDSSTICKQEDIEKHPGKYVGTEDQVRCFGRFGLDGVTYELTLVVESDWDNGTVTATPLISSRGCRKKELGDKALEHINPLYL